MAGSYPMRVRRQAESLVRAGYTEKQVSEELGMAHTTVRRWTDPIYAKRYRENTERWKRRNREQVREYFRSGRRPDRAKCEGCAGKMSYNRARADVGRCITCRREDQRWRRTDIARLWKDEGLTSREIGERLGCSPGAIETEIKRMREDGWDVPRRA